MVVLSRNLGYRLSVRRLGPSVSLQLFLGSSTSFRYFAFLYSRIKFSCAYILHSFLFICLLMNVKVDFISLLVQTVP